MLYRLSLISLYLLVIAPLSAGAADNVCYDCHAARDFRGEVVHQPLVRGSCTSCHNPHVARFEGLLNQEVVSLCYSCHDGRKEEAESGKIHQPVLEGQCLVCHEPHVSSREKLLKADMEASCFNCHEKLAESYDHTHEPYGRERCFSCHRPHESGFPQLLRNEPDEVCFSCHSRSDLEAGHQNFPASPRDCLSCHHPHGSKRKGLLRNVLHEPYKEGCRECHGAKGGQPETSACLRCHPGVAPSRFDIHNHVTGKEINVCVNCHSPHAADEPSLLKGGQKKLCYSCHGDTARRYRDSLYVHAEIGNCTDCHEVHGSNLPAMLKGDGNKVCSGCHPTQGTFTHPVGVEVRDPRAGQMISCTTCHNPMGSDFKYQLTYSGTRDLCQQCHKSY